MVETSNLTKSFGSFVAVDHVSLSIAQGKIVALLGPNGAGKTTVIRMLCGLLKPSSGAAVVLGVDVVADPEAVKPRIGYMSQRFSLYNDLTIDENLAFYGSVYGMTRAALAERREVLYATLGLGELRGRLVSQLGTGFRQRAAFASATLHSPGLLFLDEPTSGMEPGARQNLWDMVYATAREGTTVLVATHYMEEAEQADEVAIMLKGRLAALATPTALVAEHGSMGEVFEWFSRQGTQVRPR